MNKKNNKKKTKKFEPIVGGKVAKRIGDNQDKETLRRHFSKTPKHRCPDCHRFTFWVSDEKTKRECVWCKMAREEAIEKIEKQGGINI